MDIEKMAILKTLSAVKEAEIYFQLHYSLDKFKRRKQFVYEQYPPSSSLFPCLMNEYVTGSRADYLFDNQSDFDSIYEVGPGLVRDLKEKNDDFEGFYWEATDNAGFYTIQDAKGRYLYPQIIQQKLAPILTAGQPQGQMDAESLKRYDRKIFDIDRIEESTASIAKGLKDCVIGMRLEKWPEKIVHDFPMRENLKDLQDIPLFLIPKSHPGSEFGKLEWRLSFSLVEKEILLKLPNYQRRAFLKWKKERIKHGIKPTYLLKTILLKISCEFQETLKPSSLNIISFLLNLEDELLKSFKDKHLPNFFLPEHNLFQRIERSSLDIPSLFTKGKILSNLQNQIDEPCRIVGLQYSFQIELHWSCINNHIANVCQNDPFATFLAIEFLLIVKCFVILPIDSISRKMRLNYLTERRILMKLVKGYMILHELCLLTELKSIDFSEFFKYYECWITCLRKIAEGKETNYETKMEGIEKMKANLTVNKWFDDMIEFIKAKISIVSHGPVSKTKCDAERLNERKCTSVQILCDECIEDLGGTVEEFLVTPTTLFENRLKNIY